MSMAVKHQITVIKMADRDDTEQTGEFVHQLNQLWQMLWDCENASCFSIIEMGLFLIYIEIACPLVKTFTVQVPERQKNKFRCQKWFWLISSSLSITLPFYIAINVICGHSCTLFPPLWLQVGNAGHSFINISILQILPVVFSFWNFLTKRPYLFPSHLFLSCRHECIRSDEVEEDTESEIKTEHE